MMLSIETIIWVYSLDLFMETGGTSRLSEALRQSVVAHRLGLVMQRTVDEAEVRSNGPVHLLML